MWVCAWVALWLCHSEGELEEVLTTYTKLNKSASIFLGSNTSSASAPTKPAHNPVPAPSMQRAEMLHRRREVGDGDSKGCASDDPHRGRGRRCTALVGERWHDFSFFSNVFKLFCHFFIQNSKENVFWGGTYMIIRLVILTIRHQKRPKSDIFLQKFKS